MNMVDLREVGFPRLANRLQLAELLAKRYPQEASKYEKVFLNRGKYGQQRRLEAAVASLFPVSLF